jgi:hypothetical protein
MLSAGLAHTKLSAWISTAEAATEVERAADL